MLAAIRTPLTELVQVHTISVDNYIFRLHYRVTLAFLSICSIVVAPGTLFGEAIDCMFENIPWKSLNNWCITNGTFSVEADPKNEGKPENVFSSYDAKEDILRYHNYYRWVCLCLTIQALLFYVPHYIWKTLEGGKLIAYSSGLESPVLSKTCVKENLEPLVKYIYKTLHTHKSYAYKYFACELLNLINITGQIIYLNVFLGKDFALYGINVLTFDHHFGGKIHPADRLFPTVTRCIYFKYGNTGKLKELSGVCVLLQNSINAKIYFLLWWWFYFLAIISALVVIYRIIIITSPSIRLRSGIQTSSCGSIIGVNVIHTLYKNLDIGDWFLLQKLKQNVSLTAYKQIVTRVAERFASKSAAV